MDDTKITTTEVGGDQAGSGDDGYSSMESIMARVVEEPIISDNQPVEVNQSEAQQEQEPDPTETAAAFTIKHNGKDVELTAKEVRELAQKGYDYTAKTTQLANERRQFGEQASRYSDLFNVIDDPTNSDIIEMIQARARGERYAPPQHQPQQNQQPQWNQPSDPLEALRLDPDVYEPQLVNSVNKLIDNYKEITSEISTYKNNSSRQQVLEAGASYENEFKKEFGRDMAQDEINAIVGFMRDRGLDMRDSENFRMAGNHLFAEQLKNVALQREIEKLKKDNANGVIARTPSSGMKPVSTKDGAIPSFKGHSDVNAYLIKQFGL